MPNGSRCDAPALRGTPYCYFHTRLHRIAKAQPSSWEPLDLGVLEDRGAIQIALSQVLNALGSAKLDPRRASLFLYGLQIASQNVERKFAIVSQSAVQDITLASDGDELAPVHEVCEYPEDCDACSQRDDCPYGVFDDDDEDEEED